MPLVLFLYKQALLLGRMTHQTSRIFMIDSFETKSLLFPGFICSETRNFNRLWVTTVLLLTVSSRGKIKTYQLSVGSLSG